MWFLCTVISSYFINAIKKQLQQPNIRPKQSSAGWLIKFIEHNLPRKKYKMQPSAILFCKIEDASSEECQSDSYRKAEHLTAERHLGVGSSLPNMFSRLRKKLEIAHLYSRQLLFANPILFTG